MDVVSAQKFPVPRKRARILMPGHSGPPSKKRSDKKISAKLKYYYQQRRETFFAMSATYVKEILYV